MHKYNDTPRFGFFFDVSFLSFCWDLAFVLCVCVCVIFLKFVVFSKCVLLYYNTSLKLGYIKKIKSAQAPGEPSDSSSGRKGVGAK